MFCQTEASCLLTITPDICEIFAISTSEQELFFEETSTWTYSRRPWRNPLFLWPYMSNMTNSWWKLSWKMLTLRLKLNVDFRLIPRNAKLQSTAPSSKFKYTSFEEPVKVAAISTVAVSHCCEKYCYSV